MSNHLFNIRFGKYHWQLTNDWKMSWTRNEYWDDPESYELVSWLQVYCAFGKHF